MNAVALIEKFATQAWDKVYKQDARSSLLDNENGKNGLLQFTGVKTVRMAKFSSDGLGNYQRANKPTAGDYAGFTSGTAQGEGYGYPEGDVSLQWEEFTLNVDRAKQLRIELFDNEETGGLLVTATMTDFNRTKVVPEVDAYVFSKLVEYAGTVATNAISLSSTMGYNANGPMQALNDAFLALDNAEVPEEDQIIFASPSFINMLRSSNELVKVLKQNEYKENVSFQVYEYMGRQIVSVAPSRFRTLISLDPNGYSWKSGSKTIDFIVCAKKAIYHVVKYNKVRVISPERIISYDGYAVNVRIYHDVFVPDNKRIAIYAHVSDGTAPAPSIKFIYNDTTKVLSNVAVLPGDLMIDGLYVKTTSAPDIGTPVLAAASAEFDNELVIGTDCFAVAPYVNLKTIMGLTAGTYYIFGVRDGKVVATNATDTIVIS